MPYRIVIGKLPLAVAGTVLALPAMQAPSPVARPAIEVATIKLNTGDGRGGMRGDPGRFTVRNFPKSAASTRAEAAGPAGC